MGSLLINKATLLKASIFLILLYVMHGVTPKLNAVGLAELDLNEETLALSSSSLLRQLIWVSTAVFGCYLLTRENSKISSILNTKLLLPFYFSILCIFVSAFYADYTYLSLKRISLFLISTGSLFLLVYLGEVRFKILDVLKACFVVIAIWDVLSIVAFNGVDYDGYFRGVHGQKNSAGAVYSYFVIFFLNRLLNKMNRHDVVYLALATIFLLASFSKTSVLIVGLYILLAPYPRLLNNILASLLLLLPMLIVVYFLRLFDLPFDFLTGRGAIWEFLRYYSEGLLTFGYGYGSFWGVGSSGENTQFGVGYLQLINNAHNGYVDLLLAGGVILLLTVVLHLLSHLALLRVTKEYEYNYFCSFCLFSLVLSNVTETTMFSPNSLSWVIYLISFFCILNFNYRFRSQRNELI